MSAVSRAHGSVPSSSSISDDLFLRDNPLYCSRSSSSSSSSSPSSAAPAGSSKDGCASRGRSVSRASGSLGESSAGRRSEKTARSLSRVDIGRRRLRSVSREHCGNLETDTENRYKSVSNLESREDDKRGRSKGHSKSAVTTTEFDAKSQTRNLQTWTSRHLVSESWDESSSSSQATKWEDGILASSLSEAEEGISGERVNASVDVGSCAIYETVRSEVRRAVSEIRGDLENAIWKNTPGTLPTASIEDMPSEFTITDDLVSDVRREYVSKLEQTQEHARKLRADLAIEEQREQELSRILNEITHTQRNADSQKAGPKRKGSIERLRMSRRLAEEAMNYFDECVSISTFDSSDFSSFEDPQPSSIDGVPPISSSRFLPSGGPTYQVSDLPNGHVNHHEELDNQTQYSISIAGSDLGISSSCSGSKAGSLMHVNRRHDDPRVHDTSRSEKLNLSLAEDRKGAVGDDDIRQYIKKFEKGIRSKTTEHLNGKPRYCPEDYESSGLAESYVFDSVMLRNRIESGGLLICDFRTFS